MTLKITLIGLKEGVARPTLADIDHFHWVEDRVEFPGVYMRDEMWGFIHKGGCAFIIDPDDPLKQKRITAQARVSKDGVKYVSTAVDGQETQHLLKLPDCGPN